MRALLLSIFNDDFSDHPDSARFHARFFSHPLTLTDLRQVCEAVSSSHAQIGGKSIPGAALIKGKRKGPPFAILAQLHGNEPAGLAGILLAMALSAANKLEGDVLAVIGNPLAAGQYFDALGQYPGTSQEMRDMFRSGVDDKGGLLPDMNRIPVDFLSRVPDNHHIRRAHELYAIGRHINGIVDIHSARGNMLCITDHKRDADLKDSPIRSVLTGLAEAISTHASAGVTVQTLKTILSPLPNIECQVGIEAGRHEAPEAPHHAASFTLSLLHTLKLTQVVALYNKENGIFQRYAVQPRLAYGDLPHEGLQEGDMIYMAKTCHSLASVPPGCDTVIVKRSDGTYALQGVADFTKKPAGEMAFAVYQYDEMEAIRKGQAVAVAIPSGATFTAPSDFSGIFFSKAGALYDRDPAVGPWPVAAANIGKIKFCYPCKVGEMKIF